MNWNLKIALGITGLLLVASPFAKPSFAQEKEGADPWCVYEPANEEGPGFGKHVVLISGDEEYRSEEALPMLGKLLSQHHSFKCTVLFPMDPENKIIDPNNQKNIPGMHLLADADLVIIALRFRALPDEQMKDFDDYLMAGKPIIALRTSTHAFKFDGDSGSSYAQYDFRGKDDWAGGGFGVHVLGETWVNHHGNHGSESTRGIVNPEEADHPILKGVTDVWGPTDVYGIRQLPDNSKVLLHGQVIAGMEPEGKPVEGEKNEPMMPLAWYRTWETPSGIETPIFCTTMGAASDFESAGLRRLIVNAVLFMTDLGLEITDDLNVEIVDEFTPTVFGFNRFQKGKTPADYDLKR